MSDHYWKQREKEEVERKCGCWFKGRCENWDWIENRCEKGKEHVFSRLQRERKEKEALGNGV